MTEIFRQHGNPSAGTDKGTNHNYGPAYESLFPDRNIKLMMMEIGIASGECLAAWAEIFPNAHVVGLDIHPCALNPLPPRVEIHLGDMRDYAAINRAIAGRYFDFVIDDATHELDDNLRTLFWIWPWIKPGGIYVIEEMCNIMQYRENIKLFTGAAIIDTQGPFGGNEPLVVIKK